MDSKVPLVLELETLGAQMKKLEEECPKILDPNKWTILRVDGHKFSTFTQRFKNRRDQGLIDAMLSAAEQWLKEFQGSTIYVQSDEATMAIPPINPAIPGASLMFNGRTQKLISLSAGLFSTRFNAALPEQHRGLAYFDCRAFQVDSDEMLYNAFRWRQLDAFRNGASTSARLINEESDSRIPKKLLEIFKTKDKLDMVKNSSKFDDLKGDHIMHGTFIKRVIVDYGDYVRTEYRRVIMSNDLLIQSPTVEWLKLKATREETISLIIEKIKKTT